MEDEARDRELEAWWQSPDKATARARLLVGGEEQAEVYISCWSWGLEVRLSRNDEAKAGEIKVLIV